VNHRWVWPLPPRNEHRRVRPSLHGVTAHCVVWFRRDLPPAATLRLCLGKHPRPKNRRQGKNLPELGTEPPWTDTSEYCKCYILPSFLNTRYRSVKQIYLDIF
jgi:hypothetical protein